MWSSRNVLVLEREWEVIFNGGGNGGKEMTGGLFVLRSGQRCGQVGVLASTDLIWLQSCIYRPSFGSNLRGLCHVTKETKFN